MKEGKETYRAGRQTSRTGDIPGFSEGESYTSGRVSSGKKKVPTSTLKSTHPFAAKEEKRKKNLG